MSKRRSANSARQNQNNQTDDPREPAELRLIGGTLRHRKLAYSGDERTRPMKDRVREAVFNLVGPAVQGMHALDLFAGTGALGLEAISRGAAKASFVEQHFPTADLVRQNIAQLGVQDRCEVAPANTFIWVQRLPAPDRPWLAFCSPPYAFYVDRRDEILAMLRHLAERGLPGTNLVVEADERFDFQSLEAIGEWDVRHYPPAFVGIWRKEA